MIKKITILFSILISSIFVFLMIDIYTSNFIYMSLDSVSTTVSYYISKDKGISESVKQYVKKEVNGTIYCANDDCEHIKDGEIYTYIVSKNYKGIILNRNNNEIRVKRSVIIGEYR